MKAVFKMDLKPSAELLYGNIAFFDDNRQIGVYVATSGAPGYQTEKHFKTKGKGPCPPYKGLEINSAGYRVATKGVEGWFFPIIPSPIPAYNRSEVGLHYDANYPGSAGCIVIQNRESFEEQVVPLLLAQKGKKIPLEVIYS